MGRDIVAAVGDRELVSSVGALTGEELLPDTDAETFEPAAAVQAHVAQPRSAPR